MQELNDGDKVYNYSEDGLFTTDFSEVSTSSLKERLGSPGFATGVSSKYYRKGFRNG